MKRARSTAVVIPVPLEHEEQATLIEWADAMALSGRVPELALLHSIPNGARTGWKTAKLLVNTGVRRGIPDLFLPVARGKFHGLYLELKRVRGGCVSAEQKQMIAALQVQGYRVEVCKGADAAMAIIVQYLRD